MYTNKVALPRVIFHLCRTFALPEPTLTESSLYCIDCIR